MSHIINMYNKDTLGNLVKLGSSAVSFKTGTAYIKSTGGEDIPLAGISSTALLEYFSSNVIEDALPTDINAIKNKPQMYLRKDVDILETLPTESVHHILVEHHYTVADGISVLSDVTFKRLSFKTLASDVEVLDMRLNESLELNGYTDAETLINYIIFAELDLDPAFSTESNKAILLDKENKSTNKLKLALNTMDDPVTEQPETNYDNKLISGKGGLALKKYVKDTIASLMMYKNVVVTNKLPDESIQSFNTAADKDKNTLKLSTSELRGIKSYINTEGALAIEHAYIGSNTVNITPVAGQVLVINGIDTDDMGHITKVSVKNIYSEIEKIYPSKVEANETYVKRSNPGTEYINSAVEIMKNLTVQRNMLVKGNLTTKGAVTSQATDEVTIKDNIIDIGSANDTVNRYTGMRLRIKSDTDDENNIFLVYDNQDKAFTVSEGDVDPNDPNSIILTDAINLKANRFIGTADTAETFSNPVTLKFTGDVQGTTTFSGNEGTVDISLTAKKATHESFGVVKLLEDLNVVPGPGDVYVYSSKFLHDNLKSLKSIEISNDYIPPTIPENATEEEKARLRGTKRVATQYAIYSAYKSLYDFQKKYDAEKLQREATARINATKVIDSGSSIEFIIRQNALITPVIDGIGYDEVIWNAASIKTGIKFHEFWKAKFDLDIDDLPANQTLFTIMPKKTNIVEVIMPKVKSDRTPYSLSSPYKFYLLEYDNAEDITPAVIHSSSSGYNIDKQMIEYDLFKGNKTSKNIERFINHLEFSDWSAGKNTNYQITRTRQAFVVDGPSSFINNVPTEMTRLGSTLNMTVLRLERSCKGFSVDLSDINTEAVYVSGIKFKIPVGETYSYTDLIEVFIYAYRYDGTVIKLPMCTSNLHLLTSEKWYTILSYIKSASNVSAIPVENTGIYSLSPISSKVNANNINIGKLISNGDIGDSANIVKYSLVFEKSTNVALIVSAPIFALGTSVSSSEPMNALMNKDYDSLFYSVDPSQSKDTDTKSGLDPTKFYEVVAKCDTATPVSLSGLFLPSESTFGTYYNGGGPDDLRNLLPHGTTEQDSLYYSSIVYNRHTSVPAILRRKTSSRKAQVLHTFFEPESSTDARDRFYVIPTDRHVVLVEKDLVKDMTNVFYKFNSISGDWVYWCRQYETIPAIATTKAELEKWTKRTPGDVIVVVSHPSSLYGSSVMYWNGSTFDRIDVRDFEEAEKPATALTTYLGLDGVTDYVFGKMYIVTGDGSKNGVYECINPNANSYVDRFEKKTEMLYGYSIQGTVNNVVEFNEKYTNDVTIDITHARVGSSGSYQRYVYKKIGATPEWVSDGVWFDPIRIKNMSMITSVQQIAATGYKIPTGTEYIVIGITESKNGSTRPEDYTYPSTALYYKCNVDGTTLTWTNMGPFSSYRKPVANFDYTGELNTPTGTVTIPVQYVCKYIENYK